MSSTLLVSHLDKSGKLINSGHLKKVLSIEKVELVFNSENTEGKDSNFWHLSNIKLISIIFLFLKILMFCNDFNEPQNENIPFKLV
jgi:hypothetical protein